MNASISIWEYQHAVAQTSRSLAAEGLAQGTAGNVSIRVSDRVLATGSGVDLAETDAEALVETDLNGSVLKGRIEPTSELSMHLEIYRRIGEPAGAVVHAHPPYATALSVSLEILPVLHYEQLALGGEIRVAPFAAFGSDDLAAHVGAAIEGRKAAILANHGAVAYGDDLTAALRHMRMLEWFCTLFWRAKTMGDPRALTQEQQGAVIEQALRLGYGAPRPR